MEYRDQVFICDVFEGLKKIPDGVVQCCVTSPPYWGLRDYEIRGWFGGNSACEHVLAGKGQTALTYSCSACGAWYGQLGLEPTPDLYVEHLVSVFREVRRVLREDGVVFLNLGDSYAQAKGAGDVGLKPKDLVGIPWRVAFALQADGWYLRADIIWSKGNCMPESVTDRPTKSHEYVFLLSKSAQYFYDSEAIKEPSVTGDTRKPYGSDGAWAMDGRNKWEEGKGQQRDNADGTKRNKRSVWTINSKPYKGAHFAVMPSELASECIKVGSSEKGCCSKCGKPLERIINISKDARAFSRDQSKEQSSARRADGSRLTSGTGHRTINGVIPSYKSPEVSTLCWELSCSCQESFIPCLVLDPFAGSGTTLAAAACLGRSYVGIEINQQYEKFIESRLRPVIEDRNQRESFELMMGLEHCDRD